MADSTESVSQSHDTKTDNVPANEQDSQKKLEERLKRQLKPQVKGDKTRTDYDVAYEHDKTVKKKFRLKIVYNKKGCLASGHCVLSDPFDFELDEEFKAVLKDSKEQEGPVKGIFIKEVETDEPHLVINAAKTCTPKVIAVIDLATGKRIAP